MTNEIKEHMQNCIDREESCLLNSDNTKILLNYITNLQEDLANYVNVVLHNRKVIDNLKQRIDKAVEYIKWNLNKNEELIEYFNYDANFNELLNILRGDE